MVQSRLSNLCSMLSVTSECCHIEHYVFNPYSKVSLYNIAPVVFTVKVYVVCALISILADCTWFQ